MCIKTRKIFVIMSCMLIIVVFTFSAEGSREFIITAHESKQYSPAIHGDAVVWTDNRNENSDIYGLNLSTREEVQITTNPEDQKDPAIYGDIVVWEDNRNGNWVIYGADISPPYILTSFKSGTRIIPFDFSEILWTVSIVLFVYLLGSYIWCVKKFGYTPGALSPSEIQPKDFRRSALSTLPYLVLAGLFALMGFLSLTDLEQPNELLFIAYSAFFVLHFIWNKKFPSIRITYDEIIFFETLGRFPTVVKQNAIQKINVQTWTDFPYKAELLLSDGKKIFINFSSIDKKDREDLIQALTQVVS